MSNEKKTDEYYTKQIDYAFQTMVTNIRRRLCSVEESIREFNERCEEINNEKALNLENRQEM